MITRKYYLIGNSKSGTTTRSDDSGITPTFGTDETCDTGDVSIYSQPKTFKQISKRIPINKNQSMSITEINAMIAEIVRKENDIIKCRGKGWLKPHKQIKPGNNSKINYNLPRRRLRKKKQIFPKAA